MFAIPIINNPRVINPPPPKKKKIHLGCNLGLFPRSKLYPEAINRTKDIEFSIVQRQKMLHFNAVIRVTFYPVQRY